MTDDQFVQNKAEDAAAPQAAPAPAVKPAKPGAPKHMKKKDVHEEVDKAATAIYRILGWALTIEGVITMALFVIMGGLPLIAYLMAGQSYLNDLTAAMNSQLAGVTQLTMILGVADAVLLFVSGILLLIVGRNLRKNRRRKVAVWSKWLIGVQIVLFAIDYMISGPGAVSVSQGVSLAILAIVSIAIDPSLVRERRAEYEEDLAEDMADAKIGMLGRDKTGRGYLRLDFFNLFWFFFICCILGLILEIIWHMVVVDPGHYQDRAGLLVGPFSPIYGFGAVLITLALNRLYNKNIILTFLVAGLVGASFEFATSWFMQNAFGVLAWDYSDYTIFGYPDPIAHFCQGRTSTMFFCIWGILGLVWVKLIMPVMLKGINVIPWKLRYILTAVVAVFMVADGLLTLGSFDCWYQRSCGIAPSTPIEQWYAQHFDNTFMTNRFQSMTMNTQDATRVNPEATLAQATATTDATS